MNPLVRHHREVMRLFNSGMGPADIAAYLYAHALGPIDPSYRDKDIACLTGLVREYLADPIAAQEKGRQEQERRDAKAAQLQAEREAAKQARQRRAAEKRRQEKEIEQARLARRQAWEEEAAKVAPWRTRDWTDVLPPDIAAQQANWCRHMAARRMKRAGLTLEQIGHRLRISRSRALQIVQKAQRYEGNPYGNKSPLERWLEKPVTFVSRWQDYADPSDQRRARRALKVVEAWTGLPTVPPCTAKERQIWELYYAMREEA